jgi:hypothetical protein
MELPVRGSTRSRRPVRGGCPSAVPLDSSGDEANLAQSSVRRDEEGEGERARVEGGGGRRLPSDGRARERGQLWPRRSRARRCRSVFLSIGVGKHLGRQTFHVG